MFCILTGTFSVYYPPKLSCRNYVVRTSNSFVVFIIIIIIIILSLHFLITCTWNWWGTRGREAWKLIQKNVARMIWTSVMYILTYISISIKCEVTFLFICLFVCLFEISCFFSFNSKAPHYNRTEKGNQLDI